jgi:prevent-host-death family protein
MMTTVSAQDARARFDALLTAVSRGARFEIRKRGRPVAVLLGVTDFDDLTEELDAEFQRSLRVAAREHRSGSPERQAQDLRRRTTVIASRISARSRCPGTRPV